MLGNAISESLSALQKYRNHLLEVDVAGCSVVIFLNVSAIQILFSLWILLIVVLKRIHKAFVKIKKIYLIEHAVITYMFPILCKTLTTQDRG